MIEGALTKEEVAGITLEAMKKHGVPVVLPDGTAGTLIIPEASEEARKFLKKNDELSRRASDGTNQIQT